MERIGELAYNPVREHIKMRFRRVKTPEQQIAAVVEDLLHQRFDPSQSRVLIFVRTRQQAEETADKLSQLASKRQLPWAGQIDYFHAGLDGTERDNKYRAYKGEQDPDEDLDKEDKQTLVLVATKAFGMGMDIPHIHYLYHLGPSGTFEDFLQEVGRAGRNAAQREQAGFVVGEREIETLCIFTSNDFRTLRDLLHKSDLKWQYVADTQERLHEHLRRLGKLQRVPMQEPHALPLDLDPGDDGGVRFRLALHWLEELERLRLGMFTPTYLPLTLLDHPNYDLLPAAEERAAVRRLIEGLRTSDYQEAEAQSLSVPMEELQRVTDERDYKVIFRLLFRAQKAQALVVDRALQLSVTKTRDAELRAWHPRQQTRSRAKLPLVEALFDLAGKLVARVPAGGGQRHIGPAEWTELVDEVGAEHFTPIWVYWEEEGPKKQLLRNEALCQKLGKDWRKVRAKFALKLVRLLPGMKTKTLLTTEGTGRGERVQLISGEAKAAGQWAGALSSLREHLLALLSHVVGAGRTEFNYAAVVVALGLEAQGVSYVDNLLFLARALAYLQSQGAFVPTGIELFVQDITPPDRDNRTAAALRRQSDFEVYQNFEEGRQLRQLRLLALECLADLPNETQDAFIKQYFGCEGSAALVSLLGEYLGEDHENLQAFREQALLDEEAKLNDAQRRVYEAPLKSHLQVIAGPGSGKTHTLTLRVARLIHRENVPPEQIVVLAYNRAVVVELKERLSELFRKLGYGRLISRLHVYTFHGFCQRVLGARLEGLPYDEWVPRLIAELDLNPTLLQTELRTRLTYVFVDEFQDITSERLGLLQTIAPPEQVQLCVIGDPNQSIYGHEKAKVGEPMNPHPYYVKLWQHYRHETLYLSDNYRSYPAILEAAAGLLADNPQHFKEIPSLRARREPVPTHSYCEVLDAESAPHWWVKLRQLLTETYQPGPDRQGRPQKPRPYQQVAVMLRSNDEVFRAYTELEKSGELPPGVTLRVQGASGSPVATREFRELLQPYYAAPDELLAANFLEEFKQRKDAKLKQYTKTNAKENIWDPYLLHLVHCLFYEFRAEHERRGEDLTEATHRELLDFITDLARHDDGHFAKLYDKHIKTVAPDLLERQEVVLTTMHRVKGLEFDAVLLPPSFMNLGLGYSGVPLTGKALDEVIEEERRLLYVAYTRARYRLVVLRFKREAAVAAGQAYTLGAGERQRLGHAVKDELGKVQLYWGAEERENRPLTFTLIRDQLKVGEPVTIGRDGWGDRVLECQGAIVGKIGKNAAANLPAQGRLQGLVVSHISCYSLEESLAYDARYSSNYTAKWGSTAKERGYIYVVDFAGYYKEC